MRIPVAIAFLATAGIVGYFSSPISRVGEPEIGGVDIDADVPADSQRESNRVQSNPVRFTLPDLDEVRLLPIATEMEFLNADAERPEDDVELLMAAFRQYRRALGQNPVGTNEEIVAALAGRNPKTVALISPEHTSIDDKGQLLDRWGTPYFFHQRSGADMQVISAGPDRVLFNRDDVAALEQGWRRLDKLGTSVVNEVN